MNITLTHNTPNVSLATLEIDLEGLDRPVSYSLTTGALKT